MWETTVLEPRIWWKERVKIMVAGSVQPFLFINQQLSNAG